MTDPIETTPLPALAGFGSDGSSIRIVRPLTDAELSQLDAGRTVYGLAAPIMQMFGIITLNYGALTDRASGSYLAILHLNCWNYDCWHFRDS